MEFAPFLYKEEEVGSSMIGVFLRVLIHRGSSKVAAGQPSLDSGLASVVSGSMGSQILIRCLQTLATYGLQSEDLVH